MNQTTFMSALIMLGFRRHKQNSKYLYTIGNKNTFNNNAFYLYIDFTDSHTILEHTPFIEITGSKISYLACLNYQKAYNHITNQKLN